MGRFLRHAAQSFIRYKIGNGRDTWMWFDNWHPKGPSFEHYGPKIVYDFGSSIIKRIIDQISVLPDLRISLILGKICLCIYLIKHVLIMWNGPLIRMVPSQWHLCGMLLESIVLWLVELVCFGIKIAFLVIGSLLGLYVETNLILRINC